MKRLPVTLLTGFLVSGKTTLLNRLVANPKLRDTAIVVNEFGTIGLDHHLITGTADRIVLLQNGCLCCSIRGDLLETLHNLLAQHLGGEGPSFSRVIIETSGLAEPGPILHTLMTDQVLAQCLEIDAVVVTVDALAGRQTLERHPEATAQLLMADRILITKADLTRDGDQLAELVETIRSTNLAAPIVHVHDGLVDPGVVIDIGAHQPSAPDAALLWLEGAPAPRPAHLAETHSTSWSTTRPITARAFDDFLSRAATIIGPELLRMKAMLDVESHAGPVIVHAVQHVLHPPTELPEWPGERRSTVVLISRQRGSEHFAATTRFLRDALAGSR